jgi:hypothetical protein
VLAADLAGYFSHSKRGFYDVRVAEEGDAALGLLCEAPESGRCILRWTGDDVQSAPVREGDLAISGLSVILTRKQTLSAVSGKAQVGGSYPLLDAVHGVRARMMSYRFSAGGTEGFLRYRGTSSVAFPDGLPVAAWEIRFSLRSAFLAPLGEVIDLGL